MIAFNLYFTRSPSVHLMILSLVLSIVYNMLYVKQRKSAINMIHMIHWCHLPGNGGEPADEGAPRPEPDLLDS
jgi:hypothetical protein